MRNSRINIRVTCRSRRKREQTFSKTCKAVSGFGGLLACHQVSHRHPWLWLYGLDCRCSLLTRSRHVRPVKRRWNKRLKMRWRSVIAARQPSTGHWWGGKGGSSSHWDEEWKDFGVVSSPFHLKLSLLLVCFLSWNSVIALILKFKYINFYLCISILVWVSWCECLKEWCTWHTVWGHVVNKNMG